MSKLGACLGHLGRDEQAEEYLIRGFAFLQDAGRTQELQAAEARLNEFYESRAAD